MRVIVTGSRDWPWAGIIVDKLDELLRESDMREEPFYLNVGDCPTGADWVAREWWAVMNNSRRVAPDSLKVFEADWNTYGKGAGPVRNGEMVDFGADLCLGFQFNGSNGTADCLEKAWKAKIRIKFFELKMTVVEP